MKKIATQTIESSIVGPVTVDYGKVQPAVTTSTLHVLAYTADVVGLNIHSQTRVIWYNYILPKKG